jgi:hypothetical protein
VKSRPAIALSEPPHLSRLHDKDRNIRAARPEHVGQPREQHQTLVRRGVNERHERARFERRDHGRPVDRRLDRCADQTHLVAIDVGQKLAARERVVHVLEVPRLVVAETSNRIGRGDAALARPRHDGLDHRMRVAGDHLIGCEVVQQSLEQRLVLRRLPAIGSRFVVAPREQHRDRDAMCRVVDDRPVDGAVPLPLGSRGRRARQFDPGQIDAPLSQVILDREGDRTLEPRRRQDVAGVARVGQPFHDRAQALRHSGRRIADAMIVRQQKPHESERIDPPIVRQTR